MRYFLFFIFVTFVRVGDIHAAERWDVIVLDSDACAKLDDAEIKKVLNRTQVILKQTVNADVTFKVVKRSSYRKCFDAQSTRIAPYESSAFSPYFKDKRFLVDVILRQLKLRNTIEEVRKWWPNADDVRTLDDAAERLADVYLADIDRVKKLKGLKGQNVVTEKTWSHYSVSHLGERLHSMDWSDRREVYLTNVPIIDTSPQAFAVKDIGLGAVMNSIGLHASNKVVVSTFKIMSNNLRGGNTHLKKLSATNQRHAVSYLLAQVIARTSLQLTPKDESPTGLLRSFSSLKKIDDFTQIAAMKLGKNLKKDGYLYHRSGAFRILLRQDIFATQKAWKNVVEESGRMFDFQLTNHESDQIVQRAKLAIKMIDGN